MLSRSGKKAYRKLVRSHNQFYLEKMEHQRASRLAFGAIGICLPATVRDRYHRDPIRLRERDECRSKVFDMRCKARLVEV